MFKNENDGKECQQQEKETTKDIKKEEVVVIDNNSNNNNNNNNSNYNNDNNDGDIDVGDLFLNKNYVKKVVEYFGVDVTLNVLDSASTDFDLTGQVIWPSAQVLTQYIIKNQEQYKNKEILEVGSGVGVCGLFLARLGQPCTLSDNNEIVLDLLRLNVEESTQNGFKCDCVKLDWGNQQDMDNCLTLLKNKDTNITTTNTTTTTTTQPNYGFDIILGSDIVYWKIGIEPLFKTVSLLLKNNENSKLIICYQSRSLQTDNFLLEQATLHGFEYEFLPIDSFLDRSLLTFKEESSISIIHLIVFKRIQIK